MASSTPFSGAAKLASPLVLFLAAAVMAAAVAWIAYRYLQDKEAAISAEVAARGRRNTAPLVAVAVPRVDAAAGTVVDAATFVARPVEEDLVYPGTVLARDFDALRGQTLARPVLRGRPLRLADVVAPEVRDVAAILPSGRRALTIEIDNVNSIAQALRPGHHIDIYLLHRGAGAGPDPHPEQDQATLYMQDVVVLATGAEFRDPGRAGAGAGAGAGAEGAAMARPGEVEGKDPHYDTVTLLVTPQEAARLAIGQKMGSFRVALRGAGDHAAVRLATLRADGLLPGAPAAHPARAAGIEFIVGGHGDGIAAPLAAPLALSGPLASSGPPSLSASLGSPAQELFGRIQAAAAPSIASAVAQSTVQHPAQSPTQPAAQTRQPIPPVFDKPQ